MVLSREGFTPSQLTDVGMVRKKPPKEIIPNRKKGKHFTQIEVGTLTGGVLKKPSRRYHSTFFIDSRQISTI